MASVAPSHPTLHPLQPRCWPGSSFTGCSSLNPANCNSGRRHRRPFSPTVTACHMLYCSSPSWEASDCSQEPPRSAKRTLQLSRCTGAFPLLERRRGKEASSLHGSIFVAGRCLLQPGVPFVFLRAALPALLLSRGAPGCGHVSVVRLAETCLIPHAPGLPGCCVGMWQRQPGDAETFSAGCEGGSEGRCLW